ncbi:MAG: hypothetical protein H6Q17_2425 [Bacteroidetes bacterium]|jgi:hypothetical protein|nr:hypothetical protein [Bacteroidota bacterium]
MKKNIGILDKGIRLAIALIIVILDINDIVTGTLGNILLIVAVLLVITTFLGFCPLYLLFGWNTNKKTEG